VSIDCFLQRATLEASGDNVQSRETVGTSKCTQLIDSSSKRKQEEWRVFVPLQAEDWKCHQRYAKI